MKKYPVIVLSSLIGLLSACGGGSNESATTNRSSQFSESSESSVSVQSQTSVSSQQVSSETSAGDSSASNSSASNSSSMAADSTTVAEAALESDWYFDNDFPLILRIQDNLLTEYRLFPPYACYTLRHYTLDSVDSSGHLDYTRASVSGDHYSATYEIRDDRLQLTNSHLPMAQGTVTLQRRDQLLSQYAACENLDRKGHVDITLEFLASPQDSLLAGVGTDVMSTDYLAKISFDINHNGKYDRGDISLTVDHVVNDDEVTTPWAIEKLRQYITINSGENNNFGYALNFAKAKDKSITFSLDNSKHPAIAEISYATQVYLLMYSETGSISENSDAIYQDYLPAKNQFTSGIDTHLISDPADDVYYSTGIASLPKPVTTRGDIDVVGVSIIIADE